MTRASGRESVLPRIRLIDKLNQEINAGLADPKIKGAACRPWRYGACGVARRFRQTHRGRNREVGHGGEVRGPQAGLIRLLSIERLHKPRYGNRGPLHAEAHRPLVSRSLRNGAARKRTVEDRNGKSGATHRHAVIKATLRRKSAQRDCEIFDFNLQPAWSTGAFSRGAATCAHIC
jgi:hypothetical protein